MADIKAPDDHFETLKQDDQEVQPPPPEVLVGLSDLEIKKLGLRTTLKLDLIVMPAMTILYILNYLDRQNIAASNLANITEDLDLSTTQYNTTVSILFVGYSMSFARTVFTVS